MSRRQQDRLGDLERKDPVVLTSATAMVAGLLDLELASSFEAQLVVALSRLADLAIEPLKVFEQAGLPHELGLYAPTPEGTYIPLRTRPTPKAALVDHVIVDEHGSGIVNLATIGLASFPANSKVGFAAAVLRTMEDLRTAIRNAAISGDLQTLKAVNLAMATVLAHRALTIEFVEGPNIRTGRSQRVSGSRGGFNKSESTRLKISRRNADWQSQAEQTWAKYPDHTISAVARVIFANQPKGKRVSVEVIRKAIAKPGHLGST